MRFPNLFLCDIIAPWSSQAILFTFLFHEGDLKSSAGRVWVTRPALFVFTCLPVRPASRRRSVPVSHPYRRRCARPSRYAHQRSDRAQTDARRRPTLRRKIRDTPSCVSYSLVRAMGLEPTRPYGHKHLKLACLPIPARSQTEYPFIIAKRHRLSRGADEFPLSASRAAPFLRTRGSCRWPPPAPGAASAAPARPPAPQ